jgi:hypothetical protein
MKKLTSLAIVATGSLVLSGCVGLFAYDQSCAEIQIDNLYPPIFLNVDPDDLDVDPDDDASGDVTRPRLTTQLDWSASAINGQTMSETHFYVGVPTALPNLIASALVDVDDSFFDDDFDGDSTPTEEEREQLLAELRADLDFIKGSFNNIALSVPEPYSTASAPDPNQSLNSWSTELDYFEALSTSSEVNIFDLLEVFGGGLLEEEGISEEARLAATIALHLPAVVGVTCGYQVPNPGSTAEASDFDARDYFYDNLPEQIDRDGINFLIGLNVIWGDASAKALYPGFVADQMQLDLAKANSDSQVDTLSFSSRDPDAFPITSSVIPWFKNSIDLGFPDETDLGLAGLDPVEQFWSSSVGDTPISSGFWGAQPQVDIDDELDEIPGPADMIEIEFPLGLSPEGLRAQLRQRYLEGDSLRTDVEQFEQEADEFAEGLGELEYLLAYTLFFTPIEGFSLVAISYSIERFYLDPVTGDLLTEAQWLEGPIGDAPSAAFAGPMVSAVSPSVAAPGSTVTLSGSRLDTVSAMTIDGKPLVLGPATASSITATLPADLSPGTKDLVLTSSLGSITVQSALSVTRAAVTAGAGSDAGATASIRRLSEGEAKVWVRDVVGEGKVQIFLNGRELGWVRAIDATDPKLRVPSTGPMAGRAYFVRTAQLAPGKNVLEVYVEGERVRRVAYTR